MRVLESDRIVLKPIEEEDLPLLLELRWDETLTDYLIHDPISMVHQKKWFEKVYKNGDLALSIFYKENEQLRHIGLIGLYDFNQRHRRATWKSLRIIPEYQGKGIAMEASLMLLDYGFNTLNLHKITSDSFEENSSILKLLEKLGFKREGVLIEHYFHQGKYKNAVIHSVLREEFNEKFKCNN